MSGTHKFTVTHHTGVDNIVGTDIEAGANLVIFHTGDTVAVYAPGFWSIARREPVDTDKASA